MTLYINSVFSIQITLLVIFLTAAVACFIYVAKTSNDEPYLSVFGGIIFTMIAIIMLLIVLLNGCSAYFQRINEPVYYASMIAEGESLTSALNNSQDIVNTDLYLAAVDYNTRLAEIKNAYNDPKYSMSFSGYVDWSTVSPIILD